MIAAQVKAIGEAAVVLKDEAAEKLNAKKKSSEKREEMNKRKGERDDLKAKLGLKGVGMTTTAKILAERS